jgi:hypothetical protein
MINRWIAKWKNRRALTATANVHMYLVDQYLAGDPIYRDEAANEARDILILAVCAINDEYERI